MRINLQDLPLHQSIEDGEYSKDLKRSSFPNSRWQALQKTNHHKKIKRKRDE